MALYNAFIQIPGALTNEYILALNKEQVTRLVDAYLQGMEKVKIKGIDRNINNPKKFIIYSISQNIALGDDQVATEKNLHTHKQIAGSALFTPSLLNSFGGNVTDEFTKGQDWGALRSQNISSPKQTTTHAKTGKIFISHSVKDVNIVRAFTEDILQVVLDVKPEKEIFNISIEDAGIKTGEDFKKRIESELKTAKAVIQILTENYKKSEACLNEMGAAWVLNLPVIPFVLEPITYNNVGFIHNANQQLKLDSKNDLKKFVAQNKGVLFSASYDDAKLDRKIDEFLILLKKQISKTNAEEKKSIKGVNILEELKKLPKESPFYRINNHTNIYLYREGKFREIPDEKTAILFGYRRKWDKVTNIEIPDNETDSLIDKPLKSIFESEIWQELGAKRYWIIYENRRHATDTITIKTLYPTTTENKIKKNISSEKVTSLMQGDAYDLFTLDLK